MEQKPESVVIAGGAEQFYYAVGAGGRRKQEEHKDKHERVKAVGAEGGATAAGLAEVGHSVLLEESQRAKGGQEWERQGSGQWLWFQREGWEG